MQSYTNKHLRFFVAPIFHALKVVNIQNPSVRKALADLCEALQRTWSIDGVDYVRGFGETNKQAFTFLGNITNHLFDAQIHGKLEIEYTDGTDYQSELDAFSPLDLYGEKNWFSRMAYDVRKNGRIKVYKDANPNYLTPEQNRAFRIMHDLCHVAGNYDFSLSGETKTFILQGLAILSYWNFENTYDRQQAIKILRALHSEIIGQVCALRITGKFSEQKPLLLNSSWQAAELLIKVYCLANYIEL